MKKQIMLALAAAVTAINALGWGQKGHDVVSAIAQRHFTEKTAAAVDSLLDGRSPIYYANWLDNASHTPEYAYSKTWHYKNINADERYELATVNSKGDIITALTEQIQLLQNPEATKDDKALALKMVIHLMGDLHQPMHMGHGSDLGGNKWIIKYFNRETNLHTVWDTNLPESAHKWSYTEWVDQIDRVSPDREAIIVYGDLNKWGKEIYFIAGDIYKTTPQGSNLSYDYIAKWTPVIEDCFLSGGLRLADILNTIFDPDYVPKSNAVVK